VAQVLTSSKMTVSAIEVEDEELMSLGSRPWSEATFGGGTSFEVQSFVVQPGLEEPPGMPVPEPWPEVPAPPSPMLAPEEPDDPPGTKKRKKRMRPKKRTPETVALSHEARQERLEQDLPRLELDLESILQSQVEGIEAAKQRLEAACREELERLHDTLQHAVHSLDKKCVATDRMIQLEAPDESCTASADFSTLEEAGTVLDAKCCSGSPVMAASWSPIQVLISPQSQVKDVASPREVSTMKTGAKMKEWPQRCLVSGVYALFAQWITLLSMVVIWLDTDLSAVMSMERMEDSQPAWMITVRVLNWICTAFFTLELVLRFKAMTKCKELWSAPSRFWNLFDTLIVLLAWADEIYILVTSSGLQVLRVARVLRVGRLFRFCPQLESWATALLDSLHALCWSIAVMTLVLYTASICLTSSCADWVKGQMHSADPGWADLLDQGDSLVLPNNPKHAELVMSIWAWFGSLPRCSYTLLRCLGGWGQESQALLQVGFVSAAVFQLYFWTMLVVVFNVTIGLVVDAIVASSRRSDQRMSDPEDLADLPVP